MKKWTRSLLLFLLGFLAGYLAMTYGPGMSIKLAAPPAEYFLKNLAYNGSFKALVGAGAGLILALFPLISAHRKGTKVTK